MAHFLLFTSFLFLSALATSSVTDNLSSASRSLPLQVHPAAQPTSSSASAASKRTHTEYFSEPLSTLRAFFDGHKRTKLRHHAKKVNPRRLHRRRQRRNSRNQNRRHRHEQQHHEHLTSNAQPTTAANAAVLGTTVNHDAQKKIRVDTDNASFFPSTQYATQQSTSTKDIYQSLVSRSSVDQHFDAESVRTNNQHHSHSQKQYPPKKHAPTGHHQPAAPPPKNNSPEQKHKQMITTPTFGPMPNFVPGAPRPGKRSQPSKKTNCTFKRKRCGTKCHSTENKKGACQVTVQVPKICQKNVVVTGLCSGGKPKLCSYVETEPSICIKKKKTKVRCPPEKYRCQKQIVQEKSCPPDGCDRWRKRLCKKHDPKRRVPCKKPPKSCKDCRRDIFFAKCKRVRFKTIGVPCPQKSTQPSPSSSHSRPPLPKTMYPTHPKAWGASQKPFPSPSPSPCNPHHLHYTDPYSGHFFEPLPPANFKERRAESSAIRCVAFSFVVPECKDAKPVCRMGSGAFNKYQCMLQACSQCSGHLQHGSKDLHDWCHQFQQRHCSSQNVRTLFEPSVEDRAVVHNESSQITEAYSAKWADPKVSEKPTKCLKKVAVTEYHTCKKKLPGNEMCYYGCRVKKCRPPPEDYYCKDRMPRRCPKLKKKICKTKKTITTTCTRPGKKNCNSEINVSYICEKKKNVQRPCKKVPCRGVWNCALEKFNKKCSKTISKNIVCGQKKETKMTACSWRGSSNCKAVYCNVKVCH